MKPPPELIDKTHLPGGEELKLVRDREQLVLVLDGTPLMTSSAHFSEEALAEVGCRDVGPDARVLIGGLGMGYTLRATLDRLGPKGEAVVSELVPAVVRWNKGPLAELAGRPLDDPRTRLEVGDIVRYLRSDPSPFDAILLDTDNGPDDFTAKGNRHLYDAAGLRRILRLLKPGGRLVVWSAYQCPPFVKDLERAGFQASKERVKARGAKGGRHTLYVGRRPRRRPS